MKCSFFENSREERGFDALGALPGRVALPAVRDV